MESDLILIPGGLPPLSARGCVQQVMPIETGVLRRTIQGKLIYVGKEAEHKYRSVISCDDKAPLALEGLWRGTQVRVGCIQRLTQKAKGREVVLGRDPVGGSVVAMTAERETVRLQEIRGRKVLVEEEAAGKEGGIFVSYRPWLDMRIVDFTLTTHEWGLKAGWRLVLEEI